MMKKGIVLLVLMMITAGLAFASGSGEDDGTTQFWGGVQDVTLTGAIDFTALGTTITADGETWVLLYPRYVLSYVEIEEGDVVTVQGLEIPASRLRNTIEDENYVRVVSAEIDGNTYNLFDDRYEDFDDWYEDGRGNFDGRWGGFRGWHGGPYEDGDWHHRQGRKTFGGPRGSQRAW